MNRIHPQLCFVIMPFEDGMKEIYREAIKPACENAKFDVLRSDDLHGPYNIHKNIIKHIFSSDIVIADLTKWNPNVFYEMGVAHAIGNKTIMIIQVGEDLPFDVVNYQCIKYHTKTNGYKELSIKLESALKAFDEWSLDYTNPVQLHKPKDAPVQASELQAIRKLLRTKDEQLKIARLDIAKLGAELDDTETIFQNIEETLKRLLKKKDREIAELEDVLKQINASKLPNLKKIVDLSEAKLTLREKFNDNLLPGDVKTMLKEYDFYCADTKWSKAWCNPSGIGVPHYFQSIKENKVIYDAATGLYWQHGENSENVPFTEAKKYVKLLNRKNFAGFSDWRLPTLEEAMSLMEPEKVDGGLFLDGIFNFVQENIWTCDSDSTGCVWYVNFKYGECGSVNTKSFNNFIRAVRS